MGGSVPGGFSVAKRNVYENGLVLSPRPLFKAGEPVPETWSLIFDNVRFGEILCPDMQTVCAELALGERLLLETVERYGVEAVHGAMRYVCDAAAERIARGSRRCPTAPGSARRSSTATASTTPRSTGSARGSRSTAAGSRSTSAAPRGRRARASTRPRSTRRRRSGSP